MCLKPDRSRAHRQHRRHHNGPDGQAAQEHQPGQGELPVHQAEGEGARAREGAGGRVEPRGAQERFRELRRQEEKMLRGVEKAEADGRDALDALAHESDALKARKAAVGAAEDTVL